MSNATSIPFFLDLDRKGIITITSDGKVWKNYSRKSKKSLEWIETLPIRFEKDRNRMYFIELGYNGVYEKCSVDKIIYCKFNNLENLGELVTIGHIDDDRLNCSLDNLLYYNPNEIRTEKKCPDCKKVLLVSEFGSNKARYDGLTQKCKLCANKCGIQYIKDNPDKAKKYNDKFISEHPGYQKRISSQYYEVNKDRILNKLKNNREHTNKVRREFERNNPHSKLAKNFRNRIRKVLKGVNKSKKSEELLGCSFEFFKEYIEKQFTEEMNWNNHGSYWHCDHKIPVTAFNLLIPEEQQKCFHYTNLQPMEAISNIKKSSWYNGIRHTFKEYNI